MSALLVFELHDLIVLVWGYHPVSPDFPDRSTNAFQTDAFMAAPRSLAATGESRLISFPRGTEMFHFPGSPRNTMYSCCDAE